MTTFEINIRTFRGEKKIDVDPSWTVQRLSEELYEKFRHLKIPRPEHQKLVRSIAPVFKYVGLFFC